MAKKKNRKFKESCKDTMNRYAMELQQGCRVDINTGACVPLTEEERMFRLGFLDSKGKLTPEQRAYMQGLQKGKKAQRRAVHNARFYDKQNKNSKVLLSYSPYGSEFNY